MKIFLHSGRNGCVHKMHPCWLSSDTLIIKFDLVAETHIWFTTASVCKYQHLI